MAYAAPSMEVELYTVDQALQAKDVAYKGLIMVNKVKTRNVLSDIGTAFKSIGGGELKNLTKLTSTIRNELIQMAVEQAQHMGANAIVGIRFECNTIFEGTLDMVMYGTAVQVAR